MVVSDGMPLRSKRQHIIIVLLTLNMMHDGVNVMHQTSSYKTAGTEFVSIVLVYYAVLIAWIDLRHFRLFSLETVISFCIESSRGHIQYFLFLLFPTHLPARAANT